MKNKVILLGVTPPPVGGIAQWTMRMLSTDLGDKWELKLIDEKILGNRDFFGSNNKYNYFLEVKRWFGIWRQLNNDLKDENVRVVHSCPIASIKSMLAEYISAFITARKGKKFIIHFRCTVPNMVDSKIRKMILKVFCNKADFIIVLNSQTEKYLKKITSTPIKLIPNFVSVDEVKEKQINDEIKVITYVGGVIPSKGCDVICQLAKEHPQYEFRLVGKSNKEIEKLAKETKNINLVGVKDKSGVKEELSNSDVFLFLSKFPGEGFSNALAEAMGAGLPCIVSDWAANGDMVENGKGGVVLSNIDNENFKNAIFKIKEKNVRMEQSLYNLNKVTTEYSEEKVVQQYLKCYEEIIGEKK